MAKYSKIQLLFIAASLVAIVSSAAEHEKVWPHPQKVTEVESYQTVDGSNFNVISSMMSCDIIHEAIKRYSQRIFVQDCSMLDSEFKGKHFNQFDVVDPKLVKGKLTNVTLKIESGKCEQYPYMKMDESYEIDIDPSHGGVITAKTVWGALRAFETFSQLLDNTGLNQFVIKTTKIVDQPRFSHRGLMIDSSRHFLPMKSNPN